MIHSQRLETWLGRESIAHLRQVMRGWYGRPICLIDLPGSVWITADGDFVGRMPRGFGFYQSAREMLGQVWRRSGRLRYGFAAAGFASIADALSREEQGFSQRLKFNKTTTNTPAAQSTFTTWKAGNVPVAGGVGGAAPGGTAHASTNTGAMSYANPNSGTMHLIGADAACNNSNWSVLLYDRLFSVAKTMNSTATEAVTGVPTRYQSTTATAADYAGDNFGFIEVATTVSATAHNWTVCNYTDQDGNTAQTMPSLAGISGAVADRCDQPLGQWFVPLAVGDTGIAAWSQMQCDALVAAGAINFCIGHPLGLMAFPLLNTMYPFDWLTNRDQAPRIFDNACLAFLFPICNGASLNTTSGHIVITSAA